MREKFFSIICAFSLLLNSVFPVLSASVVYADESTQSATVTPQVTPSPAPESSPEPTPAITPSPTPEISPAPSESPFPTTQPENTPSSSPNENNNQANAPPSDSPSPSVTPSAEISPSPSSEPAHGQISVSIIKNSAGTPRLDLNPTNASSASLTTDKNDYSPTETVIISGTNFAPKTDYTLIISSSDNPAVNFETKITTNDKGTFIYSYQLDGNYRPNYKIEVKDSSGAIVASTAFTDSPASGCTPDSAGANDQPGQKDLTKMCVSYSGLPTNINVSWNWDDISWSGANTGDACSLFDTDGDGNANYALCVGVNGDPAIKAYTKLYSCTDHDFNNCTSSTLISATPSSTCTTSLQSTDPFSAGSGFPVDTESNCNIVMSEVGGSSSTLIDVCSYPSESPSSHASDCILFKSNSGKLTVTKVLSPSNDPGLFNLQIDGVTQATDVSNGGSTLTAELIKGNHTFGETAGTATTLSDYTSSVLCKDNHGTGSTISTTGTNPWTVNIGEDEDILCTITNTRISNASITIVKDAQPNDAQDFAFTTTGTGLSSFSLDDDSDGTLSNTQTFSNLAAGTYSVSEGATTGWTQTSAVCSDGSPVSAISLQAGENVTCTFINTRNQGTIELKKIWSGTAGQTTLNIGTSAGGTQTASQLTGAAGAAPLTTGIQTVSTGTYFVSETGGLTDYNSSLACTDDGSPVTPGTNNSLSVTTGHAVICTFTNTLKPTYLTLVKTVTNNNGGSDAATAWTLSASGPTPISGATGTSAVTNVVVGAGAYTLSESGGPTGYTAGTYSCVKNIGAPVVSNSISLAPGDSATCTINNDDNAPVLHLRKTVTNDNGGSALNTAWTLTATGTVGSPTNLAGTTPVDSGSNFKADTYTLSETGGSSGYTASQYSCVKNSSTPVIGNSITLGVGDTAICTITNDDVQPKLTVTKVVVNDNGGTKVVSDFPLFVDATSVTSGVQNGFSAGTYTVSETNPGGYTGTITGNCASNGNITLSVGDVKSCIITNNDQAAHVIVIKNVTNNDNGTKTPSDFTMHINGTSVGVGVSFPGVSGIGTDTTVNAGNYTVSEESVAGYSGSMSGDCSGSIANGETKTCTVTNDDQPANLIVIKHVVNDNGGTAAASDFTMHINGTSVGVGVSFPGAESPGINTTVKAGSFAVTEDSVAGYSSSTSGDCSGTVANGETKTCTITNNDQAANIVVIKHVVTDNGGTKTASDFTMRINGTAVGVGVSFAGAESPGVNTVVNPGTFNVTEDSVSGYSASASGDCSGSIALGETKTCTITNNDQQGTLVVQKNLINDNGGTLNKDDFSFQINGGTAIPFEADGQNDNYVNAGTYNITEPAVAGYSTSYNNCSDVVITNGGTQTCYITNNDIAPTLTLNKVVTKDNGGTADASEWTLTATGPTGFSGSGPTVSNGDSFDAGTYDLSESGGPSGYSASSWICTGGTQVDGDTVTVALGQTVNCTITNDDLSGTLIVKKVVINDNGGTLNKEDFSFKVNDGSAVSFEADGQNDLTVNAGTYNITEPAVSGYTTTYDDCSNVAIPNRGSATCTITNNDNVPSLTLQKIVVTDNGGTAVASDWSLYASSDNVGIGGTGPTVSSDSTFSAGTYTLSEVGPSGYTPFAWVCEGGTQEGDQITLGLGESTTCTIINDDIAPQLTVIKHVITDDGGVAVAGDFIMNVTGTNILPSASFAGSESGTTVTLDQGSYSVDENAFAGYTKAIGDNCSGTINVGESKTCTITNNDAAGTLIVKKIVINDNGGTKLSQEFSFEVNDGNAVAFESDGQNNLTVDAGTYSVTEPQVSGYDTSYDNCSSVVIPNGGTATCTITNDDIQPKLTVTKVVVNDNGGSVLVSDFPLFVNSTQVTSGVQNGFNAGSYTVSETSQSGYSETISGDCTSNGNITLALGNVKFCTITNDDESGTLIVRKVVVNDDGGTLRENAFSFSVNGASAAVFEADGQNDLTVNAGTYNITEPEVIGYATSYDNCADVNIPNGGSATCIITNDDIAPTLTLVKNLPNDNGGTATQDDFNVYINGVSSSWGTHVLAAGSYTVSEDTISGYTPSVWGTDCVANGTITLNIGDEKTCSITNDDEPGKISGKKFNDLDGDHVYTNTTTDPNLSDWTITLDKQNDSNPPLCASGTIVGELCVTTTNSFGNYAFFGLEPGTYIVSEVLQSGWVQTRPDAVYGGQGAQADGTYILTIGSGTEINDRYFGNQGRSTITVHKNVDTNGDSEVDETNTTNWTWDIDGQGNFETGDTSQSVAAGSYTISEDQQEGYHVSALECNNDVIYDPSESIEVTVDAGQDLICTFTNTRDTGSLQVNKEVDSDGDGEFEGGNDEANDLGFRWGIDSETPEHLMGGVANPLPTGTYSVSENEIAGYTFTGWYDNNSDFGSCDEPEEETLPESVNVSTDNQSSITLCNVRDTGRIIIQKLIDEDGDLQTTDDRTPGVDWIMDVDGTGQDTSDPSLPATDGNGETQTGNIKTGEYTAVEGSKEGYHIVSASCSAGEESSRGTFDGTDSVDGIQVGKDETVNCTFINTKDLPPVLTLTKINNKTGVDVSAGANVLYTLTLILTGSPLSDVTLIDLPPAGFKYRTGSFTAVSNLNPGLVISEPVYASPGTWNLGNMAAGEIITLTYIADIDAALDPGLYKDLAWSKGKSLAAADILANKSSSPEFFVGTEVNVVKNIGDSTGVEVERKERGEVLGISTSLPATGVNTIWVVLAALLIAGGVGLMWQGMNLRRKYE